MGKRGVRAGTRTVHGNHLTQTVSTAMMPLRNECLRWVRQPSCRVTLNRLAADDFCCYVMPLGITPRQESFCFGGEVSESSASSRIKRLLNTYSGLVLMGAVGIPVGIIVGAICALFGRVLLAIGAFRDEHITLLIPFLALMGLAIVLVYRTWGKGTDRGMSLVFDVGHGREDAISPRLVPLIMLSTWGTHLFGGSAGREGVAVQIGATVSHWIGRRLPFQDPGNTFLLIGMAAGFAGLFRTPLAATVFAIEVLVAGRMEYRALFPALTASLAASMASGALGLEKFEVAVVASCALDLPGLGRLAVLGIAFGMVGGAFAWCLAHAKTFAARLLPNPYIRVAAMGLALSAILFALWQGRYCGLGTNLISAALNGNGKVAIMPWDWALKFVLTIATLAAGYQGGEVTPLFSIGASLGVVLAGILGMPAEFCAALGYAAVFGSATNTLLAPILIGCEIFGFGNLPMFFIVCVVAYLFNMDKSIYALQERA